MRSPMLLLGLVVGGAVADCTAGINGSAVTAGSCEFATVQAWQMPAMGGAGRITLKSDPSLCLDYVCDQNPCYLYHQYGPAAFAMKCSDTSPTWSVNANNTITVQKQSERADLGKGWCLDLRNHVTVQAYPCAGNSNQKWTIGSDGTVQTGGECVSACVAPEPSFPGAVLLHPKIHFTPPYVSMNGGWHDIAGAITHNGVHHIYQGTGWNHANSTDLVHWQTGPHGPGTIHETYAGMDSTSTPCSGYITKDDDGIVCAGFRQCGSSKGVDGGAPWDVPLELRCATDNVNLSSWTENPDYMFNVSWYRHIPYDPARPWKESDGLWYQLLSMDGCNETTRKLPCEAGGQLVMWKSPALRGPKARWEKVGPVFTSNGTVLSQNGGARGHLTKEFVTIDFIGRLSGDPTPEGAIGTRIFLNNVEGNGGGEGCCDGTTSYFPVTQKSPGAPFEQTGPQGMIDWGTFRFASGSEPIGPSRKGIDLLTGSASRGLSMARTLGSEEADQVTKPGRRVLIGWTGPADTAAFNGGSAQSLPRDLSLDPAQPSRVLQQFVPELQMLRETHSSAGANIRLGVGLQAEFLASFPKSCGNPGMTCGLSVLGSANGTATTISLSADQALVVVNGTQQGNRDPRAGPLPAAGESGWNMHVYVDHSIIEVIVNNDTALVVYVNPADTTGNAFVFGDSGARLDAWPLKPANQI